MKTSHKTRKKERSQVELTVTVAKADAEAKYTELVQKYAKEIQIPGFRKGKAPVSVLESKYGESLRNEVATTIIEDSLHDIFTQFDEEKSEFRPLPYAQPQMDAVPELKIGEDFVFEITYDVMPVVKIDDFSGITIKEPQVTVGDAELKEELEAIRQRNAMVIDKKDGEPAKKDDIVTINYCELDEKGKPMEDTKREGFVFTIGTGQNIYKIDDDILGMKVGETKDITKKYDDKEEDPDLKGKTKHIRVTIDGLKERNLPDLDDELAQDVHEKYNTLEDLKADIRKNLDTALETKLREIKSNDLIEQLIEKYPMELPQSMIQAELESRWRMMAQQFQTSVEQLDRIVTSSGQTKEQVLSQMSGDSEKMLKGRIIVESLLKDSDITVTPEELDAEMARIADGAGISVEEVKKHYADPHKKEYLIDDIKEQKLYKDLFTRVKITKGDKKKFADLFNPAH